MSAPDPMVMAALYDARGAPVSILFASGATLEGTLEQVESASDDLPSWAVVLEQIEYETDHKGSTATATTRHTIATATIVAVGVVER